MGRCALYIEIKGDLSKKTFISMSNYSGFDERFHVKVLGDTIIQKTV